MFFLGHPAHEASRGGDDACRIGSGRVENENANGTQTKEWLVRFASLLNLAARSFDYCAAGREAGSAVLRHVG